MWMRPFPTLPSSRPALDMARLRGFLWMSKICRGRSLAYGKTLSKSSKDGWVSGHPMSCESRTHSDIFSGDVTPYVTIHSYHARGTAGRETGGPYPMSLNERPRGSTLEEDDSPMRYGAPGEVSSLGDGGEWRKPSITHVGSR